MKFETVTTTPQPMIFVTRTTPMSEMGAAVGEAFATLGAFIGKNRVEVSGPPVAVYRDHTGESVTVDVGFPVAQSALAAASGDIKQGMTPAGKALKALHVGPYDTLRETYAEIEAELKRQGLSWPARSWEVYVNDPETTAPADLRTEVYMPIG